MVSLKHVPNKLTFSHFIQHVVCCQIQADVHLEVHPPEDVLQSLVVILCILPVFESRLWREVDVVDDDGDASSSMADVVVVVSVQQTKVGGRGDTGLSPLPGNEMIKSYNMSTSI